MDCNKNEIEGITIDTEYTQKTVEANNNLESNKETNGSTGGDIESVPSDISKISESREDRFKRLKERSEIDRQRKYTEILESQRQANESRQKQQEDRRRKIEELKLREEERKRKVEQRRQEMDAKEKEKNENMLRRNKEREARATMSQRQIKMAASMTKSMLSTNQSRICTPSHTNSSMALLGPEKCKRVHSRSLSGCDVDRRSGYVLHATDGTCAGTRRSRTPDGFIEVDGHLVPSNTRHVGCFMPFKGPLHRVKGVLAWAPPLGTGSNRAGSSTAWWCSGISERSAASGHTRSTSANAAFLGSNSKYRKEPSRSLRVRSTSRPKNTSIATSIPVTTSSRSIYDQSLYDRLSRPRGESQPPKIRTTDPIEHRYKVMSSSVTTQPKKLVPAVPITITSDKTISQKTKSMPTSAPDSGITSSPVSEMESTLECKESDELVQDVVSSSVSTEVASTKSRPRKNTKNLYSKEQDVCNDSEVAGDTKVVTNPNEEEIYRQKLTEQRRLARVTKERQQEAQRVLEEEARDRMLEEKKRVEEERRLILEKEVNRLKALEEEEQIQLEQQRIEDELEKMKKDELERELEEKRMEKSKSEETDRMERKRRLEKIMSRVKKADESSSQSNEESALGTSDFLESSVVEEPRSEPIPELYVDNDGDGIVAPSLETLDAWNTDQVVAKDTISGLEVGMIIVAQDNVSNTCGSPSLLSDEVADIPGPQVNSSCMAHSDASNPGTDEPPVAMATPPPPQFKSRLLQSMIAKGRLSNSDIRADCPSLPTLGQEMPGEVVPWNVVEDNGDRGNDSLGSTDLLLDTRSCDISSHISGSITDCDQSRESHSYDECLEGGQGSLPRHLHSSDNTDNALTLSSLASHSHTDTQPHDLASGPSRPSTSLLS